jgi:hypothetical protein
VAAGTPGGPEGTAGPDGASGSIPGAGSGTAGPEGGNGCLFGYCAAIPGA